MGKQLIGLLAALLGVTVYIDGVRRGARLADEITDTTTADYCAPEKDPA